ncbi:39S ribosomal protein L16, mitochondrial [Microplitis mediator]|uniref:39S ribosomal protein L16, mitochondrial n=1 Tax=Microplitis mediator TaxID=375433 RepID=UPI0025562080|nr:39S ribosomal protein L16, mitochondrial [Microplitis mediator]
MFLLKLNQRSLLSAEKLAAMMNQSAGLKNFPPPPKKRDIEYPERMKLKIMDKVPQYPPSIRPFKMQRKTRLMRGPEPIHTSLIHKQYGIVALKGGRLKYEHFEVARMTFARRFKEFDKLFAIWRVDAPWQPMTKKGQGQKMGGGKGHIDHYATPVKAGRIILEVGGDVEYFQIKKVMENVAMKMPFDAKAVTYEMMEEERIKEETLEAANLNPWTWKYIIQNNLGGCHNWISPSDKLWFNKHI